MPVVNNIHDVSRTGQSSQAYIPQWEELIKQYNAIIEQQSLKAAILRGGSQSFIFGTITFEITYDQCTRVVCTTFKCILRLLGQIVFFGAIEGDLRPPVRKNPQSPEIKIDD